MRFTGTTKQKYCEKMATSDDEAAYRTVIRFCVELVMTPVETQRNLKSVERHANVSRALVYKWHGRFSKGWSENPDSSKRGRPKNDEDSIVLKVRDFTKSYCLQ